MILADSDIWIDHFRRPDARLAALLAADELLVHAFVISEVALGSLHDRAGTLGDLASLNAAPLIRHEDVTAMIEAERLFSCGIGYVDAHLLASTLAMPGTRLWTRDKRLLAQAERLGLAFPTA